ncbi:hypothetical protein EYV94_24315 [Puteibacter caeruleilacunae]|nr:hypothetical protein EYV94_24315 [Puteibacter caeruleilacunae]
MISLVILYAVNFFRTLLIIVAIFWIGRIVSRYVLPLILKGMVNKAQKNMQDQMRQQQYDQRQEGEVTVEFKNKKKKSSKDSNGDYVEFEEVD